MTSPIIHSSGVLPARRSPHHPRELKVKSIPCPRFSGYLPSSTIHLPFRVPVSSRGRRAPHAKYSAVASAAAAQPSVPWYEVHRRQPSYRTVYDVDAWINHRNPLRYFIRCFDMNSCEVLRNVLPTVAWVTGFAAGVAAYSTALAAGLLPFWCGAIIPSPFAHQFVTNTTAALSLLLVFRTTQSYNRWDEARKMWGATLNRSRDSARQAITLFTDPVAKDMYIRWLLAFVYAKRRQFQPNEGDLREDLKDTLPEDELAQLLEAPHRPVMALHVLGELIMSQSLPSIHQQQMSANISHFHDQLGGCERLLRTPLPISYTRHTSRFLFVWLTLLPLALFATCGWGTVPLTATIAVSLLKIDEISMQIEEPFSILPLDVICGRIKQDVLSTQAFEARVRAMVYKGASRTASLEQQSNVVPRPATLNSNGNGNHSGAVPTTATAGTQPVTLPNGAATYVSNGNGNGSSNAHLNGASIYASNGNGNGNGHLNGASTYVPNGNGNGNGHLNGASTHVSTGNANGSGHLNGVSTYVANINGNGHLNAASTHMSTGNGNGNGHLNSASTYVSNGNGNGHLNGNGAAVAAGAPGGETATPSDDGRQLAPLNATSHSTK